MANALLEPIKMDDAAGGDEFNRIRALVGVGVDKDIGSLFAIAGRRQANLELAGLIGLECAAGTAIRAEGDAGIRAITLP